MILPKVHSYKVNKMLTDSKFLDEIGRSVSINYQYDVPYLAGYSTNGNKIYIDRHLKLNMDGTDITKFLIVHEKTEKALIDVFRLHYQQAHHIATMVERDAVTGSGLNWNKYERFVEKYVKTIGHENLKNSPADLDLTPYKDEKDFSKFVKKRSKK